MNLCENDCLVVISNFTVSFKRMSYHVKMQSSFSFSKACMLYTSRCFSHFEMNEQEEKRVFTLLIGPKYFAKQIACVCWIFFFQNSHALMLQKKFYACFWCPLWSLSIKGFSGVRPSNILLCPALKGVFI